MVLCSYFIQQINTLFEEKFHRVTRVNDEIIQNQSKAYMVQGIWLFVIIFITAWE